MPRIPLPSLQLPSTLMEMKTQTMPDLTHLPDELLAKVLRCLSDTQPKSLLEVALVNRRLNNVVTPLLVRRWPASTEWWNTHIEHLALHLLNHPELRKQVRSLGLHNLMTRAQGERKLLQLPVSRESLKNLSEAAYGQWSTSSEPQDWSQQISEGVSDATSALVLSWTTDLRCLSLTVPHFCPQKDEDFVILRWISQVVRKSTLDENHGVVPFWSLQRVEFRHWDTENYVEAKFAAPFFYLPGVRTFVGYRCSGTDSEQEWINEDEVAPEVIRQRYLTDFPVSFSNIEELVLDQVDMPVDGIFTMVRACRRLTSLTIAFGPVLDNDRLSSNALAGVILHHSQSLEKLDFRLDDPGLLELYEDSSDGPHTLESSLKHLDRLESLTIPIKFLHDSEADPSQNLNGLMLDRLPLHIKNLQFNRGILSFGRWSSMTEVIERIVESFEKLLRQCGPTEKSRALAIIDLTCILLDDPKFDSIVRLKKVASEQGVKLLLNTEYLNRPQGTRTRRVWHPQV